MKIYTCLAMLVLSASLAGNAAYAASDPAGLEDFLKEKSAFTAGEARSLADIVANARSSGLPVDFLVNRVREGVVKKKSFAQIEEVVRHKIASLEKAKRLLKESEKNGLIIRNYDYSVQTLGEFLETGYKEDRFRGLCGKVPANKTRCEDILRLIQVQADLGKKGLPEEDSDEIMNAAMAKNMKPGEISIMLRLMWEARQRGAGWQEIKNIIMEGVAKKSFQWIKRNVERISLAEEKSGNRNKDERPRAGEDHGTERGKK